MATNANQYVVNIVPLQGIASGITASSDTAGQITSLQTNVANIQSMVNYDTKTVSADFITSFTEGNKIQFTSDINLSSVSLYSNGIATSLNSANTVSTLNFTANSYISGTASTIKLVSAGNTTLQINSRNLSTIVDISGFLRVSENAYVKTLYQTSDRAQKTNILPFSTCLDNILRLTPCTFDWISSGQSDIGFIAQDVQKIWPSLTDEGTSIAYTRIIPLLLEGIRELHGRVSTLEGRLTVKKNIDSYGVEQLPGGYTNIGRAPDPYDERFGKVEGAIIRAKIAEYDLAKEGLRNSESS
jgi:hypothetical protein